MAWKHTLLSLLALLGPRIFGCRLPKNRTYRKFTPFGVSTLSADDWFVIATVATLWSNSPKSHGNASSDNSDGFCRAPSQRTLRTPSHTAKLRVSPFHACDVFNTLSTCEFSTGRHSFTGHGACAHILSLNLRIRVDQFVPSLYPRPPPPHQEKPTLLI